MDFFDKLEPILENAMHEELNEQFILYLYENGAKRWITPHDFDIFAPHPALRKTDWVIMYHRKGHLSFVNAQRRSLDNFASIVVKREVLRRMIRDVPPNFAFLSSKTDAFKRLEKLLDTEATIHGIVPLAWRISVQHLSCVAYNIPELAPQNNQTDQLDVLIDKDSYLALPIDKLIRKLCKLGIVDSSKLCAKCHKLATEHKLSKCGRCKAVYYCNTECQQNDWTRHRGRCHKINK